MIRGPIEFPQPYPNLLKNSLLRDLLLDSLPPFLRFEDMDCLRFAVCPHAPFLDHRVVDLLLAVAPELLIREGQQKRVIREAMRGILPEPLRTRTNKVGINVPLRSWLGDPSSQLIRMFRETIRAGYLERERIVDPELLEPLLDRPTLVQSYFLWRVVALSLWLAGNRSWRRPKAGR